MALFLLFGLESVSSCIELVMSINFFKDAYSKILESVEQIRLFTESTKTFFDNTKSIVTKTYDFLAPIFSFLPGEVILLFFASIFILLWVNSLFPTTPKWNFSFVVIFLCSSWAYSVGVSSPDTIVPWFQIIKSALYLLIPVHFFGLMGLSWEMVKKFYNRNKRLNPKDLNEFLKSFDRMYHRSVATGHSILAGEELDKEFLNQILELKEFLEKVKIQK